MPEKKSLPKLIQEAIDKGATTVEEIHKSIVDLPLKILEESDLFRGPSKEARRVQDHTIRRPAEGYRPCGGLGCRHRLRADGTRLDGDPRRRARRWAVADFIGMFLRGAARAGYHGVVVERALGSSLLGSIELLEVPEELAVG